MTRQQRIVARRQEERIGTDVRVLIDGVSPEHELVLQGRLEGQAPEIDPVVYLTDCDPAEWAAGQIVSARIVAARGYDVVAAPVMAGASHRHG
jgi:ribosomal protein S12 methylthiotransferase